MRQYSIIINGGVERSETLGVINPALGEMFAEVPFATADQVDGAVIASRVAFPAWARLGHEARKSKLHEPADALEANQPDLARLLTFETGTLSNGFAGIGSRMEVGGEGQRPRRHPAERANGRPEAIRHRMRVRPVGRGGKYRYPDHQDPQRVVSAGDGPAATGDRKSVV